MKTNLTQSKFRQILTALDKAIKTTDSAKPRNRESFRLLHRLLRLKLRVLVLRDRQGKNLSDKAINSLVIPSRISGRAPSLHR